MSVTSSLVQGRINRLFPHASWTALRFDAAHAADKSTAEHSALVRSFSRQRDLFQILLKKTEGLSKLSCLTRPGFRLLADLAKAALATARRTDRELARGADLTDPYLPHPDQVEFLIEQTSELQDRLQRQMALVAQLQEDADELQAELEVLLGQQQAAQRTLAFDGMRALARRLISELLHDVTPPVLHPQLALDVLTERLGHPQSANVFAVALATAPTVARVARVTWLGEEQVELMTAAALLQDCGKLVVQQNKVRQTSSSSTTGLVAATVRPRHTQIGAAMVGCYRNAPRHLAHLIATHHERRQSASLSAECAADALTPQALLAAVSRFERLRIGDAAHSTLLTPPELIDQPAMARLWHETLDGDWNEVFVKKILVQRDGHLECVRSVEFHRTDSFRAVEKHQIAQVS